MFRAFAIDLAEPDSLGDARKNGIYADGLHLNLTLDFFGDRYQVGFDDRIRAASEIVRAPEVGSAG